MVSHTDFRHESPALGRLISQPAQCFYVPTYQRGFTWGPDQVERLFEDLYVGIDQVAAGASPATFLGSVIFFEGTHAVEPRNANALPTAVLHVVDGQQRITTWLLICSVLARETQRVLAELESATPPSSDPDPASTWVIELLTKHNQGLVTALHFNDGSSDPVYQLKPRMIRQSTDVWGNSEQDARYESSIAWYLHAVAVELAASGPTPVVPSWLPNLSLALEVIDDAVANVEHGSVDECVALANLDFVSNQEACGRLLNYPEQAPIAAGALSDAQKRGARLAIFSSFLLWHIRVISVTAPDEDYAFTLFEPLNTTGQPLTPIETLKPLVVKAEGGGAQFMTSPGAEHLQAVDRYLPEDLPPERRASRIDALITSFALVEQGEKVGRGLVGQRAFLRRPYASPSSSIGTQRTFSEGLATTATFLNDVWDDDAPPMALLGSQRNRLCLEVLRTTNHTICLPMLVRYYEKAEATKATADIESFQMVLRSVAAFWTLWRTARTTTSGIDNVHRRLIKTGHSMTGLPPLARSATTMADLPEAEQVCISLRDILYQKLKITSSDSWVSAVAAQPVYRTAKTLARYLLLLAHNDAIEDPAAPGHCKAGTTGSGSTLSIENWRAHYTIEHMAPQNATSTDPSYDMAIYEDGLIDRLGNLLLLPGGINEAIGNRQWSDKVAMYTVLAMKDKDDRSGGLAAQGVTNVANKTTTLLESADYMPFCQFVGDAPSGPLSASYVRDRSRRLAELAWQSLRADLAPST